MGTNHSFHFHSRSRGHGLHHLGLFKATCSTRQEAYDSRIIEMAKWGDFVSALYDGNILVIPGCGSEAREVVLRKAAFKCPSFLSY